MYHFDLSQWVFPHCGGSISTLVVGVFVGLLPLFLVVCCFWFAFFLTKRKSGWGICGSSAVVVRFVCGFVMWMLHMYMTAVSCTYFSFLDAYLSVRTEPLSDIG